MAAAENNLRVLVADDSPALCASLSSLLKKFAGVQVVGQVQDGLKIAEQVRLLRPQVLIMDLRISDVSGIDVLKQLREEGLRPTVIVFTSHMEEEYSVACKALGARFFFTKPQYEKVIEAIKELQLEIPHEEPKS